MGIKSLAVKLKALADRDDLGEREPDKEHLKKIFAMMNTMDEANPLKAIEQKGSGDSL